VEVVRAEIVEHVDFLNHVFPVGRRVGEAELIGGLGEGILVATNERVAFDLGSLGEKHRQASKRVRVGSAHKPVAEHPDFQWFGHGLLRPVGITGCGFEHGPREDVDGLFEALFRGG